MIFFSHSYDRFYNIWEAAAAATALFESVINSSRNDEAPAVFIQQLDDNGFNILVSNDIAATDEHQAFAPMSSALAEHENPMKTTCSREITLWREAWLTQAVPNPTHCRSVKLANKFLSNRQGSRPKHQRFHTGRI